jgi:acetyl esterase/lipase
MELEQLRRPIVYTLPGREEAAVRPSLVYHADELELLMDIYRPAATPAEQHLPAVVFIHGGPIKADLPIAPKDWGVFVSYGQLVATLGLVGITFNHRLHSREHLSQSADDIEQALRYVQTHAHELGINSQRLALWAFSGAGPLLGPHIAQPINGLRCIAAYYAALDLKPFQRPNLPPLPDSILSTFSPLNQLQTRQALPVPFLIARAGQDHPELNQTIDAFVQTALSFNAPITLINHPTGPHGFDTRDDSQQSRAVIAQTLTFLQQHLMTP